MRGNNGSELYYSTETGKSPKYPAQLRLALELEFERTNRVAIHIDRTLHKSTPDNPSGETVYMDGRYFPEAVTGDSVWDASLIAAALKPFALHHGDYLMGVRIAASDVDPYRSKIIFRKHPEADIEEVYEAIARALEVEYRDQSAVRYNTIGAERPSERERQDHQHYQFHRDMLDELYDDMPD